MSVDGPAAGAVRRVQPAPLRLRPRPDGDADPVHALQRRLGLHPLERPARAAALSTRTSASTPGPTAAPARGRCARSTRASWPGRRTRVAGDFSELHAEARPRRRRPVPRRPQLQDAARLHRRPARDHLLPRAAIAAAAEQASAAPSRPAPSCPAELADRDHQRRRRARRAPVPRGREDVPGRALQGRAALAWSRSPRPSPAPTTTASSSSGSRSTSTRHDAQVIAVSDTVPSIIGGVPIRMRSIQVNIDKPNFTINPTNCSPVHRSTRRGSATRARSPTSPPTSRPSTARRCAFKPKMTIRQLGGTQGDAAAARTRRCSST